MIEREMCIDCGQQGVKTGHADCPSPNGVLKEFPAPVLGEWACPDGSYNYKMTGPSDGRVPPFCPVHPYHRLKHVVNYAPENPVEAVREVLQPVVSVGSPLDRATIYLWQREDIGTIGEQGNHIAHVTFKMCQHVSRCMDGLDDPGDPKILTFGAWDTKALEKVMRKLVDNQVPFHEWKDPDHVHKGVIAVCTEPLACSTDESGRFEKHKPELFANYKLWPTVNVPQLLEKHLPKTETVVIHSECTATDSMGGHTEPTPVDEGLVPYISGPSARAAVIEILKDLHLVRR